MQRFFKCLITLFCGFIGVMTISLPVMASDTGADVSSSTSKTDAGTDVGIYKNIGIGLGAGTFIHGVSGKLYLAESTAFQALGGIHSNGVGGGAQVVQEIGLGKPNFGVIDLTLGAGAAFGSWDVAGFSWSAIGPQGVVGLSAKFEAVPLEVVYEWHPGIYFTFSDVGYADAGGFDAAASAGAIRWYF